MLPKNGLIKLTTNKPREFLNEKLQQENGVLNLQHLYLLQTFENSEYNILNNRVYNSTRYNDKYKFFPPGKQIFLSKALFL